MFALPWPKNTSTYKSVAAMVELRKKLKLDNHVSDTQYLNSSWSLPICSSWGCSATSVQIYPRTSPNSGPTMRVSFTQMHVHTYFSFVLLTLNTTWLLKFVVSFSFSSRLDRIVNLELSSIMAAVRHLYRGKVGFSIQVTVQPWWFSGESSDQSKLVHVSWSKSTGSSKYFVY